MGLNMNFLEFYRTELTRLEDDLTCATLAAQTCEAMYGRADLQHKIKNQRLFIAIVERTMDA
jgi:hypothetical protein